MEDRKTAPSELVAKPCLTWDEFWHELLGLPDSTAVIVSQEDPRPRFFTMGRRRYIRREDAEAWLRDRAIASPYYPRRNRRAV